MKQPLLGSLSPARFNCFSGAFGLFFFTQFAPPILGYLAVCLANPLCQSLGPHGLGESSVFGMFRSEGLQVLLNCLQGKFCAAQTPQFGTLNERFVENRGKDGRDRQVLFFCGFRDGFLTQVAPAIERRDFFSLQNPINCKEQESPIT